MYNKLAHYKTTAEEIWRQTGGEITHIVSALGTSGTIMGIGMGLKENNPRVQVVEAHPVKGHYIQGLKNMEEAIVPKLYQPEKIDQHVMIETEEAFEELCTFLKQMRLERVGAFPFSPEEGTPAAQMDFPDNEVAQQRAQMVETIQSRIMDEYNEAMLGRQIEVLVDGFDEEYEQFYGRTYADSPEIDGRVWIASQDALVEGTFVTVCIDGMIDGDLSGYLVEE